MLFTRKQRGSAAAEALVRAFDGEIARESQKRLAEAASAVTRMPKDWERKVDESYAFVTTAGRVRAKLRRDIGDAEAAPIPAGEVMRIEASIALIRSCYRDLHDGAKGLERMHLVSGWVSPSRARVMSRMEPVEFSNQTPSYVSADPASTHCKLVDLFERDGLELISMHHSHVMDGAASTAPSSVDLANMQRFVAQGWAAIGGIYSRDHFVRFFSTQHDFEISIFGKGAEVVSRKPRETIFKFTMEE